MKSRSWLILGLVCLPLVLGCTNDSTNTAANAFYTMAKQVAPTFAQSARHSLRNDTREGILTALYQTFEDCDGTAQYGSPTYCSGNMANIYKVLAEAGSIYDNAAGNCTTMAEVAINSPFPFGIASTYTCAGNSGTMTDDYANGFAIKTTGTLKEGLLTYRWSPDQPQHLEHGILQGSVDSGNGNLDIRMLHQVIYASGRPEGNGFVHRANITGNATTHAFQLSYVTVSRDAGNYYVSVVAAGISKGAGNYFLFGVIQGNDTRVIAPKYYCFPATADAAYLATMNVAGEDTVPANCTAHAANLPDDFLSDSDVPIDLSDFTGSSILLTIP